MAPENTLASFQAAIDAGADGVEFDVRLTADNVPVIFHDRTVLGRPINSLSYNELKKQLKDLLTLDELMSFLDNRLLAVIEIKPGVDTRSTVDCLKKQLYAGWEKKNIIVSSFDFKVLKAVRNSLPDVQLAINHSWSGVIASSRARRLGTNLITINQRWLWSGFIRSVTKSGYKLSTYTLNNPAKAKKWQSAGLDAVITDFPDFKS